MFHLKLNNESGIILLVALIVTFLSTMAAGAFMSITVHESRHSVWQKEEAQALFLAEAGVEKSLYYLNNVDDPDNPCVDKDTGEMLGTPLEYTENLADGYFEVVLYDSSDEGKEWIPANAYLVESTGILEKTDCDNTTRSVACIVQQLEAAPIAAALAILDSADPEDELAQFDLSQWVVDGEDIDNPGFGLPGIAIANLGISNPDNINGDALLAQLGDRLSQVAGVDDETGAVVSGLDAILEDPDLPQDLDAYANYFTDIAIDISGCGNIPDELMGTFEEPQVLYADLSQGPVKILPNPPGYGVLVLDGVGDFKFDVSIVGKAEWNGIIICARDSEISLHGGGNASSSISGALLIANGSVIMNGAADIVYSSENVNNVNSNLLLYQVYSWCGDWGSPLGADYNPLAESDPAVY